MNDTSLAGRTQHLIDVLAERALTLAVAESLTGGLVMATITERAGASDVLRGGAVVYATETKASALGVDRQLLVEQGPVDADVAAAMARGVRDRWAADIGVATTGVAGPEPQDGHPVGEVFVAVADRDGSRVRTLDLSARTSAESTASPETTARARIRLETVAAAVELVLDRLVPRPSS